MDQIGGTPEEQRWNDLINEQSVIFNKVNKRNAELEAKVKDLERDLHVWKQVYDKADKEKIALESRLGVLDRDEKPVKGESAIIPCIIDGNTNVFAPDLLRLGQAGGRQAAQLLMRGIKAHTNGSRAQIWTTVFLCKSGVIGILADNNICSAEQFESFIFGFQQASPLFNFIDVGPAPEAADQKVTEWLRTFSRLRQVERVMFCGAQDKHYKLCFRFLENEETLDKVFLINGSEELSPDLRALGLPQANFDGLFLVDPSKPMHASFSPYASDVEKTPSVIDNGQRNTSTAERRSPRILDPSLVISKQQPPPCNFYYLATCKQGQKCQYSHDYLLTTEQMENLRQLAKRSPCMTVNRDLVCPFGDNCCLGHYCPQGPNCSFLKHGKCKFTGMDMHDPPRPLTSPSRDNKRI